MKIGLISPYNIFKSGGVQECVLALRTELEKRGHTVKIITPQPKGWDDEAPAGVIFIGVSRDVKSPLHTTAQVSATVTPEYVDEVLEREKFDILHFHEPWVPMLSRQILLRSKAVNVATFHAKFPDTYVIRTFEKVVTPYTKSILKYLDAMTAVSPAGADYVSQMADRSVPIVPNGIDLKRYKPKKVDGYDEPTILYVGRLEKRKGLIYLLRAFNQLKNTLPNAQLLIAGEGPDQEKLETYIAENDLDGVTFLGYIKDEEKVSLMQKADLFCSPAVFGESFGIVLLEAMACGCPVVAGDNPGYEGVLQETGKIGLVAPRQTNDFARRLELLLTDQHIRNVWKKWAIDYVKQFDYTKIVDQYEEVYKKALRRAR